MNNEMPDTIYAWNGFSEGGSWNDKPCDCCRCEKYIRADKAGDLVVALRKIATGERIDPILGPENASRHHLMNFAAEALEGWNDPR